MKAVITSSGRAAIASAIASGTPLAIDEMIFGYRDGADPETAPAADFAFAAGEVKHTATGLTAGKRGNDAAVFSAILTGDTGPFAFNLVALRAGTVLTAVAVQEVQYKTVTAAFVSGNTIIKNFEINFSGAGTLAGATAPAADWQLDLSGLYAALGHNHDDRYSQLGHTHNYEPSGAVTAHNGDTGAHQDLRNGLTGKANTGLDNLSAAGEAKIRNLACGYPDYAHAASCAFNTGYTAAKSGWILVFIRPVKDDTVFDYYLKVGTAEFKIAAKHNYYGRDHHSMMIPIHAGDVWQIRALDKNGAASTNAIGESYIKFIPNLGE